MQTLASRNRSRSNHPLIPSLAHSNAQCEMGSANCIELVVQTPPLPYLCRSDGRRGRTRGGSRPLAYQTKFGTRRCSPHFTFLISQCHPPPSASGGGPLQGRGVGWKMEDGRLRIEDERDGGSRMLGVVPDRASNPTTTRLTPLPSREGSWRGV
jgi:hypothetical protein